MYVGMGGTCKINREEKGGGGQKLEVSSEHTFWMTPKPFCYN